VEVGLFMIHSLMIWHHDSLPELLLNRCIHNGRRPYVCLKVARTLSDARMLLVMYGIAVPVISNMIIGVLVLVLHYLSSLWRLVLLVISLIYLIIIVEVVLLLPLVHNSLSTSVTNLWYPYLPRICEPDLDLLTVEAAYPLQMDFVVVRWVRAV